MSIKAKYVGEFESEIILENHLKEVVTEIEQEGKINLVAIGIGHDVSRYYKKAFTIDSPDKLGDIIIENLAKNLK